jgi:hypothetical protein
MYRDQGTNLDEHDRAVGALLLAEAMVGAYEAAARRVNAPADAIANAERWRAVAEAQEAFPEIWRGLDRARTLLGQRGANTIGYDELRPAVRRPGGAEARASDRPALDPGALADMQRAVGALRLALPGVDWQAIEARSHTLWTTAALQPRHRNRVQIGAVVTLAVSAMTAWLLTTVPVRQPSHASALARELHQIAADRGDRIAEARGALGARCDAPLAGKLAKLLAQDGQPDAVTALDDEYRARCGEDRAVHAWARAARRWHGR